LATINKNFPIWGWWRGLRYKEGGDTPKARAEEWARTNTHILIHKTIVYIHIFCPYSFSVSIIDDNSSLWQFFFSVQQLSKHHQMKWKKNKNLMPVMMIGQSSSPDYDRKEALESPSRLLLSTDILHDKLKNLIFCTYLHIHMHVGVSVFFILKKLCFFFLLEFCTNTRLNFDFKSYKLLGFANLPTRLVGGGTF
jgi:hypothetical protein